MIDFRIWQIAGWTMLHYLWVGVVLGLLAAAVRLLLRSRGANVRYLAALACFGVLAIAPLPIAMVIGSRIPAPPPPPNDPLIASEHTPDRTPPPARLLASEESPETVALPPVPFTPPQAPALQPGELLQSALSRAAMGLPWLWLIGAPLTFLLTTLGLLGAERLRRQSRLVEDSPIAETGRRLAAALGISRRVGVAICDRIAAPVLLGIFRPLILLPAVALSGWDPQQLEMVLLHELAHVRRWDNLVNLVQRVVESLLFFHPLVWIVSAWVRREREHCCDEFVVARTRQPRAYAEMLVSLSERVSHGTLRNSPLPHGQVVSSMAERPLVARIRRILKKEEQSMQVSRKTVGLVFAGLIGIALVIGGYCSRAGHAEDGPIKSKPDNSTGELSRAATPVSGEKPDDAFTHTGKLVDKPATEIMRKLYLSREWIEKARSFRIHSEYKLTPKAEGLRPPARGYSPFGSYGKPDPRTWRMKDEWAWDESHILHRSQSHHDGDAQLSVDTTAWNGSLAISCQEPEPPDQKHYGLSNKAGQFFEHTADMALLPWGPGDGYHFWWLARDAAKYRKGNFTAPEDFELAGQEDVQGKRCHVLQSRAGLVRLYVGVADGRLYRREILVSHEGAARQLAICQKIGGASIKTLKDWWDWQGNLKLQDRILAYRSFQEAQFERARVWLRQTFDDYREVAPGCWLSFRQRMDSYETDSQEPFLELRAEQTITDVAINQPLPQDLFRIDLPEGAKVVADWRYDPPIDYTYRKDQTEAQREALRDAARPPGYKPNSEALKTPEGAVKKLEVKPEPVPKANDHSDKPPAVNAASITKREAKVSEEDRKALLQIIDRQTGPESVKLLLDHRITGTVRSKLNVVLAAPKAEVATVRAYSGLAKQDIDVCVLPLTIENISPQSIRTSLAHEWLGGEWPPTDIYAAVLLPANPGRDRERPREFKPVFLAGDRSELTKPTIIEPGKSTSLSPRIDWPGTGSVDGGEIVYPDRPGVYTVMFLLVFQTDGVRQYVVSEPIAFQYQKPRKNLKLEPAEPKTDYPSGDTSVAKPAAKAPTAVGQSPPSTRVQANGAHYQIQGDTITFAPWASDDDLSILAKHPELKTVVLDGQGPWKYGDFGPFPNTITDAGFRHIANCKKLENLNFGIVRHKITDDGLKALAGLQRLRYIAFGRDPFSSSGLSHLAGLTNIEELYLGFEFRGDDSALDTIAHFKKLRALTFYHVPITNAGLTKIKGLSNLDLLHLPLCYQVSDEGLKVVAGFTNLKTLDLQYTRVTDAGMMYLKSLTRLKSLELSGTKITDAGLEQLKALKQLGELPLLGTQATAAGVKSLQKALPKCHIYLGSSATSKTTAPQANDPSAKTSATKPTVPRLPTASKPTAETLEKWLQGKDVVEVWFAGPHVEPLKLKDSLRTQGVNTASDETFRFTPGEGGGVGSFIEVEMNVSPGNVQRLLSLEKELTARGYPLEPGHARVWSYQCLPETRKQAQDQVPKVLRELTAKIEKALPKAEVGNEPSRGSECLGAINYEVPGTLVGGKVFVYAINPMRYNWDRQTPPDQRFHLPHLGLMITAYYRPQQPGALDDASPEHASLRKAVTKAMESLIKLDGGADITEAKTGAAPKASDKAGKPSAAKPQSEGNPAETISGTVVTPGGKPAAGVFVKVCSMRGQDGMHAMWSDTATDAEGRFEIKAHKDENVVFWIVSKDYAPSTHIVHTNRGDLGRVILAKGVVLKGRAVDKDGKPLSGAWVNISCRRGRAEELINVFDYNGRSALSDQNGQFVMAPVSPGNYYLEASDHANDALQKNRPAHPLSAVFLDRTVTLQDNPPIQTVELRAVPTIVVKGQMTDGSGKPIKGPLPLFYESNGPSKGADFVKGPAFWYTARTEIDAHGNFTARLAKGPKLVGELLFSIDSACVFRTRLTKNGPWHGGDSVKLEDLDRDMTEVAIVCCKSPVVLVKPVGENGTIIADADVNVQYVNSPYHVASTRQADCRWRVPRIVPEEEIKVTVSAPGYKSQSEKLELLEGEVEQLDVMLKPVSTAAKEEPDRTPAKPAVLMPAPAVPPPAKASIQPERPPFVILGDSITFADDAIDADLAVLDKHPELKTVDLGGSGPWDGPDPRQFPIKITDAGFAHIANCKKLEKLLFGVTQPHQVTDDGLKAIEGLKQLRHIRFGVEPFSSAGLSHLAGLTNLEELDLFYPYSDSSRYDNAALDPIANLKKLRVLALYGARISDAGVAKIKGLSRLEDLQLGKSHVGDASLAIIAGFTELKTLDLQSTRVTDAGMVHLKPLAKLQWLCLKDTKITDAGLAQLKGLTQLCDLYLSDGPITEAGLKSLHDALPDLHIHGGDRRRDFTALPAYTMLTDPDIRKQYGIDIQQDKRLEAISTAFESARQSAQTIDGVRDSFRKQMEEVLTAEQRAAYKHDCQRDMASMLFNDPRRAAERLGFKLSEEQTRQFERLGQENSQFAKQHPIGDTASYHVMVKFNHEIGERALKVLTAQQRTRLYEEAERIGR